MRHGQFAAGGGIVDAEGRPALVDTIETVIGADTGTNIVFPLFDDLADDMRVGHVGAGHADHVDLAGGDRVARGGDVRDFRRMEGRKVGCGANFA